MYFYYTYILKDGFVPGESLETQPVSQVLQDCSVREIVARLVCLQDHLQGQKTKSFIGKFYVSSTKCWILGTFLWLSSEKVVFCYFSNVCMVKFTVHTVLIM